MKPTPRVFISYSRKDGEEFAKDLRQRLEAENIPLWQDRVGLEGGRDWWLQILEALDKVEFMVLILTPKALESPIVLKEWRYARQKGVCVYPVKGVSDSELDYSSMPHAISSAHFYDLKYEWQKLVNDLNTRCQTPRVPFMVDDLPEFFVSRPVEFELLIHQLLDMDKERPLAITAALRGAGGYGKTTLAKAICHDERIQNSFDDGILWVTLGENPRDITAKVQDLIYILSGNRPGFSDIQAASSWLAELLADRDILIIIDDVWNRAHLNPFLQGGNCCARLITTRNSDTLPPKSKQVNLDAMKHGEASNLLGFDLPHDEADAINALSSRLGEWPLLLKLANAVLCERVRNRGQSLADAIAYVNRVLDKRGLTAFDARNPANRNQAVSSTISVSLELLSNQEQARFDELAIFPEDTDIPLETIEKLWQHAGFDDVDTESLCERLAQLSLLHNFDLNDRLILLHDVVRSYLRTKNNEQLVAINTRFLDAWNLKNWVDLPTEEIYLWKYLAIHLCESNQTESLRELLLTYSWLNNKLAFCNVNALLSDYDFLSQDSELHLLQSVLRLSSNQLTRDRSQLTGHLIGRLMFQKSPELKALIIQAIQAKKRPWLRPLFPSLTLPGGPLLRTLEGHSGPVISVAISPDGKTAVSGSDNQTLVWELASGEIIHTLEGHSAMVRTVAISPDGKTAVSGSDNQTLVWELASGKIIHTLEGYTYDQINAVAISPDGKTAVVGSNNKNLKVWDLESGELIHTLEGHSTSVNTIAINPDGKTAVSGSNDKTLKVWDMASGEIIHTLVGHDSWINAVAISPDSKTAVSGSDDQTLKVWNLESGELIHTLEGHNNTVTVVAISSDGKTVVSGSGDQTLKVWDLISVEIIHTLVGHDRWIKAIAISPDGKTAVSGSDDQTLKVWNLESGELIHTLEGHGFWVNAVAISPDSKTAVSGSYDQTLKVWDLTSVEIIHTLVGHGRRINAVAISPDSKTAVSGSDDQTLKVWNLESGELIHTLEGHSDSVNSVAISPDGKTAVSGSDDQTLKVWDLTSVEIIHTMVGHDSRINAITISPDGKTAVSGSEDQTMKVWDLASCEIIHTMEETKSRYRNPSCRVHTIAINPNGKTAVSGSFDGNLRLWDLESGELINTLKGHSGPVNSVAISPDGKMVVSGGAQTIKVWDMAIGEVIHTIESHSRVNGVAVSPDGNTGLSVSVDKTLRVWTLDVGIEISAFIGESSMTTCSISPDGRIIGAGEESGQLHFLRLEVI